MQNRNEFEVSQDRHKAQDLIFLGLFMSMAGAYVFGNLLLLDVEALRSSTVILVFSFCIGATLYYLTKKLNSLPWGLVVVYGMLSLVGGISWSFLKYPVYVIFIFSILFLLKQLKSDLQGLKIAFLIGIFGAITAIGAKTYTSFDMLARLRIDKVHQDTLFHASIASMIKHYGISSTGLHGLVEVPYHTFSHTLIAGISKLSGISVFESYGIVPTLVFIPILLFAIVYATWNISAFKSDKILFTWAITTLILITAPLLFGKWGFFGSYFGSESHLIALGIFIMALPILHRSTLTWIDVILVTLMAIMMTKAKVSVGFIFACLWGARLIFLRSGFNAQTILATVLVGLSVVFSVWEVANSGFSGGTSGIELFAFVRSNSIWGRHLTDVIISISDGQPIIILSLLKGSLALITFLLFYFFLSWVVLATIFSVKKWKALFTTNEGIFVGTSLLAGLVVVLSVRIPGGSAGYFSNIAFFVALPYFIKLIEKRWHIIISSKKNSLLIISFGIIFLISGNHFLNNSFFKRSAESSPAGILARVDRLNDLLNNSFLKRPGDVSPKNLALVDCLVNMRNNVGYDKVLIADSTVLADNPISRCTAKPFVYPAISEHAWINVVTKDNDCKYQFYGYEAYGIDAQNQVVDVNHVIKKGMELLKLEHIGECADF